MGVYVDNLQPARWWLKRSCHLIADSDEELQAFAGSVGLRREWFQSDSALPHYDLGPGKRACAVLKGVIEIDRNELVRRIRVARAPGGKK